MILLTNGDSWTQGDYPAQEYNWKAEKTLDWYDIVPHFGDDLNPQSQRILYKFYDSDVWPKVLGRKLGWETWNCGRLGASNDRIVRSTINSVEYLESLGKKDLFVVVGLTSAFRYESWNHFKEDKQPGIYQNKRVSPEEWIKFGEKSLMLRLCMNIINLQNFLKTKNIPYLIFNAFDDCHSDIKDIKLYKYIDLENIYNKNLNAHFFDYIKEKFNCGDWHGEPYFKTMHPTELSHIAWGEHLYKYIRSNYEVF
jgi:hypothetical protein